ncbi:MAG: hypothetical protein ACR2NU_16205 [Aeoliella sp.]
MPLQQPTSGGCIGQRDASQFWGILNLTKVGSGCKQPMTPFTFWCPVLKELDGGSLECHMEIAFVVDVEPKPIAATRPVIALDVDSLAVFLPTKIVDCKCTEVGFGSASATGRVSTKGEWPVDHLPFTPNRTCYLEAAGVTLH